MASFTSASASRSALAKALTAVAISACGGFGIYGTFVTGAHNGLFSAISHSLGPNARELPRLGGPAPYRSTFTGIGAIDSQLSILVAFFTIAIDARQSWDITVSIWYLLAQFCAGFSLIVLEGLRQGNQGRFVSWTGTVGMALQRFSYTLCAPLYLLIHLFSSPVAYPSTDLARSVTASTGDLALLPFTSIFFFWVPTVLMYLPSPSRLPSAAHYGWIAFWQAFPMWQSIYHWLLKQPLQSRSSTHPLQTHIKAAKQTYYYVFGLAAISHITLLGVALIPGSAVPIAWSSFFAEVDFASAFVPYLPWNSPTVEGFTITASSGRLAELARLFLQWDVYAANTAIFVWALYLYGIGSSRSVLRMLPKVTVVGLVGGPIASAVFLLWERDYDLITRALAEKKEM